MTFSKPRIAILVIGALPAVALAAERERMVPTTTPPIVYTINYSGEYFKDPEYIKQFEAAPPDLLHIGKAVPITHHWGPIRLYQGENQYTGGPGHTLSWENIALVEPEALAERIETIRQTLNRYHEIGIREINHRSLACQLNCEFTVSVANQYTDSSRNANLVKNRFTFTGCNEL